MQTAQAVAYITRMGLLGIFQSHLVEDVDAARQFATIASLVLSSVS